MKRFIVEVSRGHRASLTSPHGIRVHHALGTSVCSPTRWVCSAQRPEFLLRSYYVAMID